MAVLLHTAAQKEGLQNTREVTKIGGGINRKASLNAVVFSGASLFNLIINGDDRTKRCTHTREAMKMSVISMSMNCSFYFIVKVLCLSEQVYFSGNKN